VGGFGPHLLQGPGLGLVQQLPQEDGASGAGGEAVQVAEVHVNAPMRPPVPHPLEDAEKLAEVELLGPPDDVDAQVERIAAGEARLIDLGKLTFIDHDGGESVRYFDNIASFGLSGAADMAFNRLRFAKKFGAKFAFLWATYTTVITYRNEPVRIQVDDRFDKVVNVNMAAVCNGQFFGGSMWIAPNAKPDDGLFDVIITHDLSTIDVFRGTKKLYKGKHMDEDNVTTLRGRKIVASPTREAKEVLLDVDGEAPGRLPATFEILPNAIFLRC